MAVDPDIDRTKAEELLAALDRASVNTDLHYELFCDRGPYCVRIPLTSDLDEGAPYLYVFTEGTPINEHGGYRWHGVFTHHHDDMIDLTETSLEFLERTWLGHNVDMVADAIMNLLTFLGKLQERR